MVLENETKYEKFVRLGDVRLRRIQEDLRKLGNLSNRRNYDFDEVAVGYLMHHISKEFIVLKQKFNVPLHHNAVVDSLENHVQRHKNNRKPKRA